MRWLLREDHTQLPLHLQQHRLSEPVQSKVKFSTSAVVTRVQKLSVLHGMLVITCSCSFAGRIFGAMDHSGEASQEDHCCAYRGSGSPINQRYRFGNHSAQTSSDEDRNGKANILSPATCARSLSGSAIGAKLICPSIVIAALAAHVSPCQIIDVTLPLRQCFDVPR